jgi:hypothetical protein
MDEVTLQMRTFKDANVKREAPSVCLECLTSLANTSVTGDVHRHAHGPSGNPGSAVASIVTFLASREQCKHSSTAFKHSSCQQKEASWCHLSRAVALCVTSEYMLGCRCVFQGQSDSIFNCMNEKSRSYFASHDSIVYRQAPRVEQQ